MSSLECQIIFDLAGSFCDKKFVVLMFFQWTCDVALKPIRYLVGYCFMMCIECDIRAVVTYYNARSVQECHWKITMRIGLVLYWCVLALHLCKGDEAERTDPKDGGRRQHWGPVMRSGSYSGELSVAANEHSEFPMTLNMVIFYTSRITCCCPSRLSLAVLS